MSRLAAQGVATTRPSRPASAAAYISRESSAPNSSAAAIRVNYHEPRPTDTAMFGVRRIKQGRGSRASLQPNNPSKRMADPRKSRRRWTVYLASDDDAYMSAQTPDRRRGLQPFARGRLSFVAESRASVSVSGKGRSHRPGAVRRRDVRMGQSRRFWPFRVMSG